MMCDSGDKSYYSLEDVLEIVVREIRLCETLVGLEHTTKYILSVLEEKQSVFRRLESVRCVELLDSLIRIFHFSASLHTNDYELLCSTKVNINFIRWLMGITPNKSLHELLLPYGYKGKWTVYLHLPFHKTAVSGLLDLAVYGRHSPVVAFANGSYTLYTILEMLLERPIYTRYDVPLPVSVLLKCTKGVYEEFEKQDRINGIQTELSKLTLCVLFFVEDLASTGKVSHVPIGSFADLVKEDGIVFNRMHRFDRPAVRCLFDSVRYECVRDTYFHDLLNAYK